MILLHIIFLIILCKFEKRDIGLYLELTYEFWIILANFKEKRKTSVVNNKLKISGRYLKLDIEESLISE